MGVRRGGRDLMAGVRPADPGQQVVFRGEVVGDVALALAAVLASDENVDQPLVSAREQAQRGRGADLDVFLVAVVGVDVDVCIGGEFVDRALGPVLGDFGVAGELGQSAALTPPAVPLVEHRLGGADVNVIDPGECRSESLDLAQLPDGVHDDDLRRVLSVGDDGADLVATQRPAVSRSSWSP